MAKFSGFCMSALLIVICLWINVCRYPNAFDLPANDSAARLKSFSQSSAHLEARANSNSSEFSSDDSAVSNDSPNVDEEARPSEFDAPSVSPADESQDEKSSTESEPQETIFAAKETTPDEALGFSADFAPASASQASGSRGLTPVSKGLNGDANLEPTSLKRGVSADLAPEPSRGVPARLEPETSAKSSLPAADARKPAASKPQGGKYVSIPALETDALAPNALGDGSGRVVGATRAENILFELDD